MGHAAKRLDRQESLHGDLVGAVIVNKLEEIGYEHGDSGHFREAESPVKGVCVICRLSDLPDRNQATRWTDREASLEQLMTNFRAWLGMVYATSGRIKACQKKTPNLIKSSRPELHNFAYPKGWGLAHPALICLLARTKIAAIGSVPFPRYVSRAETMKTYLFRTLLCLLLCAFVGPVAAARTIEFETTEVTQADVALSPDGQTLVFTMLGHLFRLPVEGGTAEQLTFGPYYDTDPVYAPDGTRVAFVSDRDGSEGNIFVLELATGQITQVTHESWAGRPTWTPDGHAIVYLRFAREVAQGTRELAGWRVRETTIFQGA